MGTPATIVFTLQMQTTAGIRGQSFPILKAPELHLNTNVKLTQHTIPE